MTSREYLDIRRAKKICEGCPVRLDCLEAGMDERFGIWGGMMPLERQKLKRMGYGTS